MPTQYQTFDFPEFNMDDIEVFEVDKFPPAIIAEMEATEKKLLESVEPFQFEQEESVDE